MYQASDSFNDAIVSDNRKFQAKITVGDTDVISGFRSIKQNIYSPGSKCITIGGVASSYIEIQMAKPELTLEGTEFELSLGLLVNGSMEWIPLGLYTSEKPKNDGEFISFIAYDRIYSKMSGAYFSNLDYSGNGIDGKKVLAEISDKTGVPVDVSTLPDGVMVMQRAVISDSEVDAEGNPIQTTTYENPFNGYSYREALGYVAMLYGMFAFTNRTGTVAFRWYTEVDYTIDTDRFYDDLETAEIVFQVRSIECQTSSNTLKSGTGATVIQAENPCMTQARLNAIYQQIKDLQFLPASLSLYGDMCLDIGDIVTVNDKYGNVIKLPVMQIIQEFDGGLLTRLQSFGGAQEDNSSAKGPTLQRLERVYTELFLVKEVIGSKASFDYVYSIDADFKNVKADYGEYKTLVTNEFVAVNGEITNLSGEFATFKSGEFADLSVKQAEFETATTQNFTAVSGQIATLSGDFASYKDVVSENFETTNAEISNLSGDYSSFKSTTTETLTAQYADIDNLKTTTLSLQSLIADKAGVDELTAVRAEIETLSGDLSTFKTSVSEELITAKGWMLEGSIGSAQISEVDANKIKSGTLDTAIVTVAGTDGRLQISDNTIQISDGTQVRVQIGKDASDDYTLAVWDAAGNLIWDALGATENTIQRAIIRDKMVADDAAIQALKIDLQSFNKAMTNQGVTISGTIVQVGDKTLNVALTEQSQLISEQGETLTDHATKIAANEAEILLRVETQTYEEDKAEMASSLSKVTSDIAVLDGQISMKVEQTDIDKAIDNLKIGARNLIRHAKTLDFADYYFGEYTLSGDTLLDESGNVLLDENGNVLMLQEETGTITDENGYILLDENGDELVA